MRKITVTTVSANAQGFITRDDSGKTQMQRYDKLYQAKSKRSHNSRVQATQETLHLNLIQRPMYRRLMYGLAEYSPAQLATMGKDSISRIVTDHERAKRVLHVMKAKRYMKAETKLLNTIFSHCNIREDKDCDWMDPLPKSVTLRSLGITTREVCEEFIHRKLLPKNFFEITEQTPVL